MEDRKKKRIRTVLRSAAYALIVFVMLRWFEHSQVYHPSARMDSRGTDLGRPWEQVSLHASDGTALDAWYFPANATSSRRHVAVLLCHGNGGNISHRLDYYDLLLNQGVNVLAFDYRGYGRSAGRPSERGTYLDAQAAYDWLRTRDFAGENIFVVGKSLGGGVASELAMSRPIAGLVLQSTYTSIPELGAEIFPWLPVRWICSICYDTRSRLPQIRVPVLVMHSKEDSIIPIQHAQRNFAAANEPKFFEEISGDHNDSLVADAERVGGAIQRFIATVLDRNARVASTASSP